jgi:triacylglycerol lipase
MGPERASAGLVGWMARDLPPPLDVTPRFLALYERPPPVAVPVLLVAGIFTQYYPGYLRRVRRALRAAELPIDTEQTVAANARAIRDRVLLERHPVVLLGQSKGPLDIHAAMSLHPEIVPKIRAFISVQAPFGGTPLASDAEAAPLARGLIRGVVGGLLRGSPRAYFEMGYAQRRQFLARYPRIGGVPTVALASVTPRAGLFLEKTRRYISETYGAANDGFVPFADAHIPGARLVRLEGLDHASIALRWLRPRAPFDPGRVARALVALALE